MSVNGVNSVSFAGKTAMTEKGNEYKKSNEGKKLFPLLGLAGFGISTAINPSYINIPKEQGGLGGMKYKGLIIAGSAIGSAAICLGYGAITDMFINKARRKDADKFAETGMVSKKTNKGKEIGAAIGLSLGALSLGSIQLVEKIIKQNPKLPKINISRTKKLSMIPMAVALWTSAGAILDHGKNKFRDKLAAEADFNAKVEEKVAEAITEKV